MDFKNLQQESHSNSVDHGFWDFAFQTPDDQGRLPSVVKSIPEKLCLLHSEVSEALEVYRDGMVRDHLTETGKPVGFASELADLVIRTMDLASALEIDLEAAIIIKQQYNRSRPYKHGKTC